MTMQYQVTVAALPSQQEKIQEIIATTFQEIDSIYNMWNPNSELSQINQAPGNISLPLSEKLEKLFLLTDVVVKITDGRFDPTIEPIQALWKKHLSQGKKPPATELQALHPSIGWHRIQLSKGHLIKSTDATSFDFGGIAKGLGVDLIVENLNQAGFKDAFVSWGGEIRASGNHPEGRPWRIFISQLEDENPEHAIAYLDLKDQAIATSGDYLQFWTIEKEGQQVSYFHIIDPNTLEPLQVKENSIASASVVAPTCAVADGLATAAMMFETVYEAEQWAETLKKENPELSFWIVVRNQNTH